MSKILLTNANRSSPAQSVIVQLAQERSMDMVIITEHCIPRGNAWYGDDLASVVIRSESYPAAILITSKPDIVVIRQFGCIIMECYFLPSLSRGDYSERVDSLVTLIRDSTGARIIVAGDFNARSAYWGDSTTNVRGLTLQEALIGQEMRLANPPNITTCKRVQGESVIDLIWVSNRVGITECQVLEEVEVLSDHLPVVLEYAFTTIPPLPQPQSFPRFKQENWDIFEAAIHASFMPEPDIWGWTNDQLADHLMEVIIGTCEGSMTKVKYNRSRRPAYWWNEEIAELRRKSC